MSCLTDLMISFIRRLIAPLAFCLATTAVCIAADLSDEELVQLSKDSQAVKAGGEIFKNTCASCHGADLAGNAAMPIPGLNLKDDAWVHGGKPSEIAKSIASGFPDKGMIAYGALLEPSKLNQVVAFILSKHEPAK